MNETDLVIRLALPPEASSSAPAGSEISPAKLKRLLSEAGRLGVLPAVSRNLFGEADARVRETTARNLWLRQEQSRLLSALAAAGVRSQAVKGVDLAAWLYPDLSWREVTDIDLLVEKAQAIKAFTTLRAAGLRPNRDWNADGLARQLARPAALAPELILATAGHLIVELHWNWPGGALPQGDLLGQPEHYLVYICRHAGKHFWCSLKWVCDIELFLRRFAAVMNWPLFWRLAREAGAELSCAVSLELCRRWFGAPGVPAAQLGGRAERLAGRAAREALSPGVPRSHPVWSKLWMAPWRHRIAMLRAWASPQPQEWNRASALCWPKHRVWLERGKHLWNSWGPGRLRRLPAADWGILLEAYAVVAVMEMRRRLLPARRLLRGFAAANRLDPAALSPDRIRRIARLVDAAANRQPVKIRCLTRSLALGWMLRRRNVNVKLRIGIRRSGPLDAHAWLEWQGEVLHDPAGQAEAYAVLPGALAQH